MRLAECEAFAVAEKKHFLGRGVDASEYPGCTLWEDTQLVEYNDHAVERTGCNIAPRGTCICWQGTGDTMHPATAAHTKAQRRKRRPYGP